jgi:hypothetical protein
MSNGCILIDWEFDRHPHMLLLPRFSGTFMKFEPGYLGSLFKQNLSLFGSSHGSDPMTWPTLVKSYVVTSCNHMEGNILISVFRSFLIWYLTWSFVIVRSMYVGGICRILRYPFIWKLSIFLWSLGFNCILSNPYGNFLLRMEWKTWTFHLRTTSVLCSRKIWACYMYGCNQQSASWFLCDCPLCLWAMFLNILLTFFEGQPCHLGIWWMIDMIVFS